MTKKEIKDLAKELITAMNKTDLEMDINLDEDTLNKISVKIVARLSQLREMINFHDTIYNMSSLDWDFLGLTEEEELIGELAKLMTLMNLFTDKEEYEKCSVLKGRIKEIKRNLKHHEDDEM